MSLAEVATRLIKENGRTVTLKKLSRTASNTSKPWRGTTSSTDVSTSATAVILKNKFKNAKDQMIKSLEAQALVAPLTGIDFSDYNLLIDGSDIYGIDSVEKIKPGTTEFLYKFKLRTSE